MRAMPDDNVTAVVERSRAKARARAARPPRPDPDEGLLPPGRWLLLSVPPHGQGQVGDDVRGARLTDAEVEDACRRLAVRIHGHAGRAKR